MGLNIGSSRSVDPCAYRPDFSRDQAYRDTKSLTVRPSTINTGIKNLVLISLGQSLRESKCPTLYTPTNNSKVDVLNVLDGQMYAVGGPLPGVGYSSALGPGNPMVEVADKFAASIFDRVILVPAAVGGTLVWDHASRYSDTIPVIMARLARLGITPSTTGVTFAIEWGQGSSDNFPLATSQTEYQAGLTKVIANAFNAGFSGRFFVALETYYNNTTSSGIRAAQAAVVNGSTVIQSGDTDTIPNTKRQDTAGHFLDTGRADCATAIFNAMHASGAPF